MSWIAKLPGAGLTPQAPPRPSRRELAAVGVLLVLGLALRLWNLGSQALWLDEAWSHDLATSSFADLWHRIPGWESTPPIYYLAIWAGNRILGGSAGALRSVGAIAGSLTVPVLWLAGRELIGRRAGLIAAALCACSPFMWWYSQEARAYSLATLLCAVSLVFVARSVRSGSWRDLLAWGLSSAAAIGTHYLSVVVVATSGMVLLTARPSAWKRIVTAGALPIAGVVALAPLALKQRGTGHTSWIPILPMRPRVEQMLSQLWAGNAISNGGWQLSLSALGALVAVVALLLVARRASSGARAGIWRAAFISLGSIALVTAAALIGTDLLIARNLLMAWPAFALMVGGSIAALRPKTAAVVAGAICLAMAALVIRVQTEPALQRIDWRPAAKLIGPAPAGGRAIAFQIYEFTRPLSVYLAAVDYIPQEGASVSELDLVSLELPQPRTCWWGGVCADGIESDYDSRPVGYPQILGLHRVSTRTQGPFTVAVYKAARPVHLSWDSVRAALPKSLRGAVLLQR